MLFMYSFVISCLLVKEKKKSIGIRIGLVYTHINVTGPLLIIVGRLDWKSQRWFFVPVQPWAILHYTPLSTDEIYKHMQISCHLQCVFTFGWTKRPALSPPTSLFSTEQTQRLYTGKAVSTVINTSPPDTVTSYWNVWTEAEMMWQNSLFPTSRSLQSFLNQV